MGAALAVALWSSESAAAEDPSDEAAKFVRRLGNEAIAILSTTNATDEQREERFRDLLDRGFAVDTIARFVLGRHWRTATPEERLEYRRLFRLYVLDTYASRLDGYAGETFDILKAQPINERDTMVSTQIIRTDGGPPIRVDYRVRQREEQYKVVDVQVEGVSLLKTQRSEFGSIIDREGFEGLVELLRQYDPTATESG